MNVVQESRRSAESVAGRLEYADFGPRLVAYLIDVIPITFLTAAAFYMFLGFDETLQRYLNRTRDDFDARVEFLAQRNRIRDLSFVIYILYCSILEASALQGSVGKRLMAIRVTDDQGLGLTVGRSFVRNLSKFASLIPLGLGFLWALWSERKQTWHDRIARTIVVKYSTPRKA